jgi:hypothetical protein
VIVTVTARFLFGTLAGIATGDIRLAAGLADDAP